MEGLIYALRITILTGPDSLAGIVRIIPQNSMVIYRFTKIHYKLKTKVPLLSAPLFLISLVLG
ncbi:hypothetical protein BFRIG_03118 [Peribacillus frigoritolerans]